MMLKKEAGGAWIFKHYQNDSPMAIE